jgi:hypothetical protein
MRIDYNGAVIPWYERPLAGGFNYTWEEKPVAPPVPEIQQFIANETYIQEKMKEGSGGLGGFLTSYVNPVLDTAAADPLKTAAMLAASVYAPYLIPVIAGADTAIAGGDVEDVLKSAAIAYVSQAVGGEIKGALGGAEGIGLPSETPYIDLPDGEFLLTPDSVPSLLSDVGLTASEIDQLTREAVETGTQFDAYTTPVDDFATATAPRYDFSPDVPIENISPELDPTSYLNIPEPAPRYDFSPETSVEQVSPEYDPTGSLYTEARAPIYDFSPETPVLDVSPELDPTGSLATASGFGISPMQALRGLSLAKGLLGGGQEGAAAPATQFRGARLPQGEVDYSGILNLLQMRSPQRTSLLG